jgi:DNA-binding CsgD family transcriptional regulator
MTPGGNTKHFAAQLVERAQAAPDLPALRLEILDQLRGLLGFETVYWGEAPGESTDSARVSASPHDEASRLVTRLSDDRRRYDVPDAIQAVYALGGVASDAECFTRSERDRLPLFAEILRPAGIRTYVGCGVEFRGRPLSVIALSRHGRGSPFAERDKDLLRAVRGSIGVVEAAFRANSRPPPLGEDHLRAVHHLSAREAQVAVLIARGLQNKEIAALLGTSPNTVRKQTVRLYGKLRVSGRVQLVAKLVQTGH